MMLVRIHHRAEKTIIAICDTELFGKKFEDKDIQLDLTSDFYKGDEKTEKEIMQLIKDAHIISLVGEKSTAFALRNKLIDKKNIIRIANIPHAQCLFVRGE